MLHLNPFSEEETVLYINFIVGSILQYFKINTLTNFPVKAEKQF